MAFYSNECRKSGCADSGQWRQPAGWGGCRPGGMRPSQALFQRSMCCADGNSWNGYKISPQKAYRYGRTPPCAPQPPYEEPAPDDVILRDYAFHWGMSWILIAVAFFTIGTFVITFILAWQLGHLTNLILPFPSETLLYQPEESIAAQMLNIASVCWAIAVYVRYLQVAAYVSSAESPHPRRVNQVALGFGLVAAFGMSLVANFQRIDIFGLFVVRLIGAWMTFILGPVYTWMQVYLSFITVRQLSSEIVCWLRVILSLVLSVAFPFVNVVMLSGLIYVGLVGDPSQDSLEWRRAAAGMEWTMTVAFVLFYLTYFDEFRYIKLKPQAVVKHRGMWALD